MMAVNSKNSCQTKQEKLDEEKLKIQKFALTPLKTGDTWYLVDVHWYRQWQKYVSNDGYPWDTTIEQNLFPGPIDNSALLTDDMTLKEGLSEGVNYEPLFEDAWKLLVENYSKVQNQKDIARKVIESGDIVKHISIEIYPIKLKLCTYANFEDKEDVRLKTVSRGLRISDLEKIMKAIFNVPAQKRVKLWDASDEKSLHKLDTAKTVDDCSLQKDQLVVIEVEENGKWPYSSTLLSSSASVSSSSYYNGAYASRTSAVLGSSSSTSNSSYQLRNTSAGGYSCGTQGLCGLNNLGNTCFMNSALQCLSNVPALTNYFKSGKYKQELNRKNPLGMGGNLAEAYARLIHTIWSGQHSSFAPREFKMSVGQFAPRFCGFQQHDSQELLSFLIDGLHEDLNRITKKPYIEMKEAGDRADAEVADESWRNHRKRNDSIVVDTLHGLFRSTVDCPECPRISVTFDPFCFLSLPLPAKRERTLDCSFVPLDMHRKLVKYKVTVQKSGVIGDLQQALSRLNSKSYDLMTTTYAYNNRFQKLFRWSDTIKSIYEKDHLFVFETDPDLTMIPLYMRHTSVTGGRHLFGQPVLIPVDLHNTTYTDLCRSVLRVIFRHAANGDFRLMISKFLTGDGAQSDKEIAADDEDDSSSVPMTELFQLKSVNSFGTQEFKTFVRNEIPVITETTYLSADWTSTAYNTYIADQWRASEEMHESADPCAPRKQQAGVGLHDCMQLFTTKEQLDKDDAWYCSNCKKHQQATKKFDLWMLPPILIIHLKRFSYTRFYRDKLDTLVNFPIKDLDLTDFVLNPNKRSWPKEKRKYNLIAVSNHYGGLGGGHYTAFAKNVHDGQWHYFDDSSVSLSSETRIVTKAAYMLIYQRQDLEAWLQTHPDQPFPYLEPAFSPRVGAVSARQENDGLNNGASFTYDHDAINNNVNDDDDDDEDDYNDFMDTSS